MWSSRAKSSTPLRDLDLDGNDLIGQPAVAPRGLGELLAAQGVAVLRLARDAVLRRAVLGGHGHRASAMGVEERRPQRVLELPLAQAQTVAETANHVRRLAHALHPAGEDDVGFAEENHLRAAGGGLDPGPAQAIHRQCRHVHGHAGRRPT